MDLLKKSYVHIACDIKNSFLKSKNLFISLCFEYQCQYQCQDPDTANFQMAIVEYFGTFRSCFGRILS